MAAFHSLIETAGFEQVAFSDRRYDTFSDAPQASSADAFGTQGVNIRAVKPAGKTNGSRPRSRPATEHSRTDEQAQRVLSDFPQPDGVYDAGDKGCGDGPLLEISTQLRAMQPGSVLEIRSTDPGVAADLPAWCRMAGHEYLGAGTGANTGRYCVRRKHE